MGKHKRKLAATSERRADAARFWEEDPETIRRFLEQAPEYEQLASEVSYILKKGIAKAGIVVSAVTFRAKTLNSFLEKISRNKYRGPFSEITDFAGVRAVCLYIA